MEHSGSTPSQAIERAKSWLAIEHANRPDLAGGTFFAKRMPLNHQMRAYVAGYVKGAGEDRIKQNCHIMDGVLLLREDLVLANGLRSWDL